MGTILAGEIGAFAFGYVPMGWAYCNGQQLQIAQYQALYGVIGTTYGGDGTSTFALPNFNGRVAVNVGQAPGTSNYAIGDTAGADTVVIEEANLPPHGHTLVGGEVTPFEINQIVPTPGPTAMFSTSNPKFLYANSTTDLTAFSSDMSDGAGGPWIPHQNDQPYLTLNICIALYDGG